MLPVYTCGGARGGGGVCYLATLASLRQERRPGHSAKYILTDKKIAKIQNKSKNERDPVKNSSVFCRLCLTNLIDYCSV